MSWTGSRSATSAVVDGAIVWPGWGAWVDQERRLWFDRAWSTEPCDHEMVEDTVRELYRTAGLARPDVVWRDSPQALAATLDALESFDGLDDQRALGSRLAVEMRGRLRRETRPVLFRGSVAHVLWEDPGGLEARGRVPDRARGQIDDALVGFLNAIWRTPERGERVWRRCADAVGWAGDVAVLSALSHCDQAILWACYIGLAGVPDDVLGLTLRTIREVGWFVPMDGLVLLAERPVAVGFTTRDPRSSAWDLHGDGRAAIRWADGTGLDYWDGLELPAGFWRWTAEDVLACDNLEVRSLAIRRFGWEPVAESLRPVAVADDPGNPGQVIELHRFHAAPDSVYPGPERVQYVRVVNASPDMDGTRRCYVIQVSPWVTDPVEAVAESFGVSADVYRGLARAC